MLTQTLYLMATDMGLGGCAIGTANIDLFARMTGIEFHTEGPVGEFALGRAYAGNVRLKVRRPRCGSDGLSAAFDAGLKKLEELRHASTRPASASECDPY